MKFLRRFLTMAILTFLFVACKKETISDGGVRFEFISRKSLEYTSMSAIISDAYANPIQSASNPRVEDGVVLSKIAPGTYSWRCFVDYTAPGALSGTYDFRGEIIIEKGKMMHITVEN